MKKRYPEAEIASALGQTLTGKPEADIVRKMDVKDMATATGVYGKRRKRSLFDLFD